jgi:hypothetical protein
MSRLPVNPREVRRKDTAVASIADGDPQHDPYAPKGWISQLIAALWRAMFDDRWVPWVRLILTAIVAVVLYKVLYSV